MTNEINKTIENNSPETSIRTTRPEEHMQSEHYRAAADGKFDVFETMEESQLLNLLTPNKNTILHIRITACTRDKTGFVEKVLQSCPAMLLQTNAKGETLLHVASRYGHERIAKVLIDQARSDEDLKNMLRASNEQQDTSLHLAVRFGNLGIVERLLEQDSRLVDFLDKALVDFVNKAGESPLYIAAERGYSSILVTLFNFCSSPATNGPIGRTALHASIAANDEVSTEKLLSNLLNLTRIADDYSWIPLHDAAHLGRLNVTKLLLKFDKDSAYVQDKDGKTALHIVALNGKYEIMTEIVSVCPGCCELVDNRGRNVLHFEVESDETKAVQLILKDYSLSNLLHEKNRDGNTPLHHCAARDSHDILRLLCRHPREDTWAFNDHNDNFLDVVSSSTRKGRFHSWISMLLASEAKQINPRPRIMIRGEEATQGQIKNKDHSIIDLNKRVESEIIVATLIATVTFTAGFTIPGGYFGDESSLQGTAILGRKTAFKAFVVSNTLALVLSTLSIILYIPIMATQSHNRRKLKNMIAASRLTLGSLLAMVVAFVTGTYAVLSHYRSLAAASCVIGTSFFLFYAIMKFKISLSSRSKVFYLHKQP